MKSIRQIYSLSEQEKNILMQCRRAATSLDPSAQVILYGSRARGEAGPESDYDLLILSDGEATLARESMFRKLFFPIEVETGAVLTVMLVSRQVWNTPLYDAMPFCKNVNAEGIIL